MNKTTAGRREKLRESRGGSLLVLAVTSLLVLAAAYIVQTRTATDPGVSAIELTGAVGEAPEVGKSAPDFTAQTVQGRQVSLSDYRGRPVWLTFGASWCAACQAEAPDIQAAYERAGESGPVVISVYISEDSAAVRDYTERVGLTYPAIADPDTRIASQYRVLGIPVHFFIDRSGVLRATTTGAMSPEQMDAALEGIRG
ncbi:MAG: TlpA disulfide reductase family protein [Candidatus Nanopelagicales bacterium]|nr:TlpA disulfide reductase family protein [Candidatus Nanopelagicales bacterium]MDZ4250122.1 TlpA disulfide reductase family protein [Candidatus Nanopelagicales bacterium]